MKKLFTANLKHSKLVRVSVVAIINYVFCAVSTPEWKDAISVFISNAANLMRSIKDLLKALQLAQAIPNNTTTTTGATCTPLVHPHVHQETKSAKCIQQQPNASVITTSPPVSEKTPTIQPPMPQQQPLVLEYSVPALVPSTATAAAQSPPTCKPLHIEDIAAVCRYVLPLKSKWKTLGIFLCVHQSSLDALESEKPTCDERVPELVALWLRQTTPPPTWQALADAVEYCDPSKAEQIRRDHLM